jgi:hypothetical protein
MEIPAQRGFSSEKMQIEKLPLGSFYKGAVLAQAAGSVIFNLARSSKH